MKMRPVKSFPGEIGFDLSSPRRVLHNPVQPGENVKLIIFPSECLNFTRMSFGITPVILVRHSLVRQYQLFRILIICGDYFTVNFFGYDSLAFVNFYRFFVVEKELDVF